MEQQQIKDYIHKILKTAGFIAALTPNPIDNTVVAFLQLMANNENLMNLLVFILDNMKKQKETKVVELSDVEGLVMQSILDFQKK